MKLSDLDPQVIMILMIMVIGGIRWFLEQLKGKKKGEDAAESATAEFEDLYEEARREIVTRQTQVQEAPPLPTPERPPPTILPTPRSVPAPPPLPDWQRKVTKPKLSSAEQAALARVQKRPTQQQQRQPSRQTSGSRVRRLLSSPSAARDAIVLAEILGPPKSAS